MAKGERDDRGGARRHQAARPDVPPSPASRAAAPRHEAAHVERRPTEAELDAGYRGASAPPTTCPTWKRRVYVERPAEFAAAAARIARARVIAIDAEFSQPRVRGPEEPAHRLSLIQIATDDEYDTSYVIDAQRLADLTPLRAPLDDPAILKLFHGIGADTRVLATRDLAVRNTLDLEAVSRSIFGQRESGLQAMLQRACDVRLDKSFQRADWGRRPLTPGMVAYAARDAEMTFALYGWLTTHYPWAVALHETAGDELPPPVAEWIIPYLDGARPRPAIFAVADAGIADDVAAQEAALHVALSAVRHPNQRARVLRLITDLELRGLAGDVRAFLDAPASEERAGAARALGRLHDKAATELVRSLLNDPVQDVRQAARLALENLTGHAPPLRPRRPTIERGRVRWSSEPAAEGGDWRSALRQSFGLPDGDTPSTETAAGDLDDGDQ